MSDTLTMEGVTELLAALDKLRADLPHALQTAMGDVAGDVVAAAQPRIPILTGAARRSVRVEKTGPDADVVGGGTAVPYFPIIGGVKVIRNAFVGVQSEAAERAAAAVADAFGAAGLEIT